MNIRAKLTIALGITLSVIGCVNRIENNDWERDNLKGKVQVFTEFSYKAEVRFGKIEKGKREESSSHLGLRKSYNEYGNKIEENTYRLDGTLIRKEVLKYDENRNLIERESYNGEGMMNNKSIYTHYKERNEVEQNDYNSDGSLIQKWITKYNDNGKIIEQTSHPSDNRVGERYVFEYDQKGNNITYKWYRPHLFIYYAESYEYDNENNLVEEKRYNADGTLYATITYRYDGRKNRTERKYYDKYDGANGIMSAFKYEYDEVGNWIRCVEYNDGVPVLLIEREYTYYKWHHCISKAFNN